MKAIGVVTELCGNNAKVVSKRSSACESCHNCEAGGACHALLVFGNQTEEVEVLANNSEVKASVGDTVELVSSTDKTLFVSAMIFLLPIVAAFVAYFTANSMSVSDTSCVLCVIIAVVISFFACSKLMNMYVKKNISVNIVKILKESGNRFERD